MMRRLMLAALLAAVPFAASAGDISEAYEAKRLCVRLGGDEMVCMMKHPYDELFALAVAEIARRQCMENAAPPLWASDQDLAKCPERMAYIKQRLGARP